MSVVSTTKLICVTYADIYSAGKKSMRDLQISFDHHIFAAGSKRLAHFHKGDYVIICATEGSKRSCFVAQIVEQVKEKLSEWHKEGGCLWDYNFTIEPVTGITDISLHSETRNHMMSLMNNRGLKSNNLFHTRFCSEKLLQGLRDLIEEGLFTPL
jgi:hypothetical protein